MKAIILAAGMGSRLGAYTQNLPKCMLPFLGRPLIDWQIKALRNASIGDISAVRGYQREKINLAGVSFYDNDQFASTNMVASLFAARDLLISAVNGIVISYGDIIFEHRLIQALLDGEGDVRVVVDDQWLPYWKARSSQWESDVESLQYDSQNRIFELGTPQCELSHAMARYVGLLYFSRAGLNSLIEAFDQNKARWWESDTPWRKSKSFKKAYMTCMVQELIERDVDVTAIHVDRGWLEFDTAQDYENAVAWEKTGKLINFLDIATIWE